MSNERLTCKITSMNTLNKNIVFLMSELHLSQSELGRRLGVSPQTVQQWCKGKTAPKGARLEKVASELGVTKSQMLDDNLPDNWMDQRHDVDSPTDEQLAALISVATETYMDSLVTIQKAKQKGILEEADKKLVKVIAEKYKDRLK